MEYLCQIRRSWLRQHEHIWTKSKSFDEYEINNQKFERKTKTTMLNEYYINSHQDEGFEYVRLQNGFYVRVACSTECTGLESFQVIAWGASFPTVCLCWTGSWGSCFIMPLTHLEARCFKISLITFWPSFRRRSSFHPDTKQQQNEPRQSCWYCSTGSQVVTPSHPFEGRCWATITWLLFVFSAH